MFKVGFFEVIFIIVFFILFFPPKSIPELFYQMGRTYTKWKQIQSKLFEELNTYYQKIETEKREIQKIASPISPSKEDSESKK